MKFKYLEPEVSGGFGEGTKLDNSVYPPLVKELHYEFDGWLGNDIVESFPCFLVSEKLKNEIENNVLTGVLFSELTISVSSTFKELYPNKSLPNFYWLKVFGKAGKDDFGLAKDYRLVVSAKTLHVLKPFNIKEADIQDFDI